MLFLSLWKDTKMVITDSGEIQQELTALSIAVEDPFRKSGQWQRRHYLHNMGSREIRFSVQEVLDGFSSGVGR